MDDAEPEPPPGQSICPTIALPPARPMVRPRGLWLCARPSHIEVDDAATYRAAAEAAAAAAAAEALAMAPVEVAIPAKHKEEGV